MAGYATLIKLGLRFKKQHIFKCHNATLESHIQIFFQSSRASQPVELMNMYKAFVRQLKYSAVLYTNIALGSIYGVTVWFFGSDGI